VPRKDSASPGRYVDSDRGWAAQSGLAEVGRDLLRAKAARAEETPNLLSAGLQDASRMPAELGPPSGLALNGTVKVVPDLGQLVEPLVHVIHRRRSPMALPRLSPGGRTAGAPWRAEKLADPVCPVLAARLPHGPAPSLGPQLGPQPQRRHQQPDSVAQLHPATAPSPGKIGQLRPELLQIPATIPSRQQPGSNSHQPPGQNRRIAGANERTVEAAVTSITRTPQEALACWMLCGVLGQMRRYPESIGPDAQVAQLLRAGGPLPARSTI
jgi:hypothetical protein